MVCVAGVALGSSTYAWFVTNTKVTAGTAQVSATTANTLLIQNADNQWATSYDFTETNTNFVPVSTVGKNSTDAFAFYVQNNWAKDTSNAITVNKVSKAIGTEYWTKSFKIKASQACKLYLDTDTKFEVVDITAYIWMEGCDYDCNNSTVNEITGATNTITATLGFCAGGAN